MNTLPPVGGTVVEIMQPCLSVGFVLRVESLTSLSVLYLMLAVKDVNLSVSHSSCHGLLSSGTVS